MKIGMVVEVDDDGVGVGCCVVVVCGVVFVDLWLVVGVE